MKFKKILISVFTLTFATTILLFNPLSASASTGATVSVTGQGGSNHSITTEKQYLVSYTEGTGIQLREMGPTIYLTSADGALYLNFNAGSTGAALIIDGGSKGNYAVDTSKQYMLRYNSTSKGLELGETGPTVYQAWPETTQVLIYIQYPEADNKVPVISGQTTFVTNVDDEKPISFFMSFLSATDETDGNVTDSLTIKTDNYTANKRVLGNHTFVVEASDSSGNKTEATISIRVVDIVAPIITGNNAVATIGYAETWNIENYRKTLTISDNYQAMTNADISIKTDGYTSNKTKLGTYTIVFKATDTSGNEGTFTKQVKVIDNVAPTFSGPTVIATSNNTILTESDIRTQLTASDFIDGNISNKIELVTDNYSGNGNKVGNYTITYQVKDNAGNSATHTVTIQRTDKIPPIIWVVEGAAIRTTPTTPISRDTIIDILQATGQIQVNAMTTFSFPLDEYSGNENIPGVYAMSVKARSTNGNESMHSFAIEVLDVPAPDDTIDRTPSATNLTFIVVGAVALVGLAYIIVKKRK